MTISRVRKQKAKGKRRVANDDDRWPCTSCRAVRKSAEFRFQMPSWFAETEYACSTGCFREWQVKRLDQMPPMARARVEAGEIG